MHRTALLLPLLLLPPLLLLSAALAQQQHPCERPCVAGRRPMTCRYDFHVENYHSMSKACFGCPWNATDCARPDCIAANGVPRALFVVNRQLPGPGLQLCLGDRVEVTVRNHLPEQTTSVHWHGLLQRGTPYMDGVPFVTQCPVQSHSAFRYAFRADKAGTHFWHSHSGCQRADGAVGFLTVRVPREEDPHRALYDEDRPEHAMLLWDWTHTPASSKFLAHYHAGDDNKADAILINGKGVARRFAGPDNTTVLTPREVFTVKQGLRYRFRIVNAGFLNCPLELSVDNHTLLVIASDGSDVKPVRVDSLVSYAGERWDVVLEASQPAASYWVRVHGLLDCTPKRAHEAAVLRYEGADPALDPAGPAPSYDVFVGAEQGAQVNPLNRGSADPATTTAAELQSLGGGVADPALRPRADVQLFVSYDFYAIDNPHIHRAGLYGINQVSRTVDRVFTPQLNHISLKLLDFPLLPGRDRLDGLGALCNESSLQGRDCEREYCECTHVVRVPLGGVLEIVLVDEGFRYDANHPFHLHGHAFRVVALERVGTNITVDEVRRMDAEGRLARNLRDPPTKDTVTVPDGGYTVLRVHADNPGYWLFHCHIEFHVEMGMALVVKVGEHEDVPPVPEGFPQCGDWTGNDVADYDAVDVDADANRLSNHIARVLGAVPPPRPPASSSATSPTRAPSEAPMTSSLPEDGGAPTTTEFDVQDATTELRLLDADDGDLDTDTLPGTTPDLEATAATTLRDALPSPPAPSPAAPGRRVSEVIMRVPPRRQPTVALWGDGSRRVVDPEHPDLRYNVLGMQQEDEDAPRPVLVAAPHQRAGHALARSGASAPAALGPLAAIASTAVCLILFLP